MMKSKTYGKKKRVRAIDSIVDLQSEGCQTTLPPSPQTKPKPDAPTKSATPPPTVRQPLYTPGSSSTTTLSLNSSPTVYNPVTPTTLELFPELPVELREQIWRCAVKATRNRIVVWRERFSFVPPLLHACHMSRKLFLEENRVEYWSRSPLSKSVIFINWEHNIVFFDDRVVGMKTWDDPPKRDDRPIRTLDGWVPHLRQNPQTGGGWLEEIRYLALDSIVVEDFNKGQGIWKRVLYGPEDNGWERLSILCPKLKKLLVIIEGVHGREPTGKDTVENLAKLRVIHGKEMSRRAQDIKAGLEAARGQGMLLELKVCFVEVRAPYSGATYDEIVL
ncbi:hypothetical protein BDZ45DRAFT_29101 [Acephala macrosclerotiorum]|nr:hypothetical protein BDZ45DRAFT_29101 [Acephala macrosclerotiorum]